MCFPLVLPLSKTSIVLIYDSCKFSKYWINAMSSCSAIILKQAKLKLIPVLTSQKAHLIEAEIDAALLTTIVVQKPPFLSFLKKCHPSNKNVHGARVSSACLYFPLRHLEGVTTPLLSSWRCNVDGIWFATVVGKDGATPPKKNSIGSV